MQSILDKNAAPRANYVEVEAKGVEEKTTWDTIKSIIQWDKLTDRDNWFRALDQAAASVYKRALKAYLNQLAYDTATYIATGDKGQKPMFETRKPGDLLKNTLDKATGDFINQVSVNALGFGLCEPGAGIKLKVNLGLAHQISPYTPDCSFSQMRDNWEKSLQDENFLTGFKNMLNPWSNDVGYALSVNLLNRENQAKKKEAGILDMLKTNSAKDKTDPITGKIQTPGDMIAEYMKKPIKEAGNDLYTYTGNVAADAVGVFIDTLIGKLIEEWFTKGIVTNFPNDDYSWTGLSDFYAGGSINNAKNRFLKIIEPDFSVRGDYNILSELILCPDPNKAGPTNCVITDNFRRAIENHLTVGDAMEQGYLNKSAVFGFMADGLEPKYNEGYPYRSMIIMRKFRILPVGWELAAQYIKDHQNDVKGVITLEDVVGCFSSDDEYTKEPANITEGWCRGLVDPNWVLKAPLNYCKREGFGPEITSESVSGEGSDSQLVISRKDDYCADEQTCISENIDGSCNYYGYCTEEKRRWLFGSNSSCEEKYNTCETFKTTDGKSISYLENSLNNDDCSFDNVGCRAYKNASSSVNAYDNGKVDWTSSTLADFSYFNANAAKCSAADDGCHEYIRILPGVNIFQDGSFEASTTLAEDPTAMYGSRSLPLPADTPYRNVLPIFRNIGTASIFSQEYYTLSLYAKNCGDITATIRNNAGVAGTWNDAQNDMATTSANTANDWTLMVATARFDSGNKVRIEIDGITGTNCRIDGIKVEKGRARTAYSDYGAGNYAYQKMIPDYLAQVCYDNFNNSATVGYQLRSNAPAVCNKYARLCSPWEGGCELYTSATKNISVPAKISDDDACPSECVGYDEYIQSETVFDTARTESFIPNKAKICSAESAGCDQFTNLDKIGPDGASGGAKGAEAIEYYSVLRQCANSEDLGCSEFYTWEGSAETGYQLRVHRLTADKSSGTYNFDLPEVVDAGEYNGMTCTAATYNLLNNSMCREFYSKSGAVSYRFINYTRTCSANCHPYRKTENNIDPKITSAALCAGPSMHWDAANSECISCINGGEWRDDHNACIYMAVPNEGRSCSANQNGCREYTGNAGANMKNILQSDFEGDSSGWYGEDGSAVDISNESLKAGGNSLNATSSGATVTIARDIGGLLKAGKAYHLTFLARADNAGANVAIENIRFANSAASSTFDEVAALSDLTNTWNMYELNLTGLDHVPDENERMIIKADGNFFIDNIVLTEIVDRYYLLKDSFEIPDSCRGYEGCDQYYDRENKNHYLRSFTELCQDSAVGCQMMIDTQNSSDYDRVVNNSTGVNVVTPPDRVSFVVWDDSKKCTAEMKGCGRFGLQYDYEDQSIYRDAYLIDNPDLYDRTLCSSDAEYCENWTSSDGSSVFKNPFEQTCEWRQTTEGYNWYKKNVKKCDDESNTPEQTGVINPATEKRYCLDDSDCGASVNCITDKNDYKCDLADGIGIKTFGEGGDRVDQPTRDLAGNDWAGFCPTAQAGCSEYIDPVSSFNPNLVFNSDFSQDLDKNSFADGWIAVGAGHAVKQAVNVEKYTLYVFAVEGEGYSARLTIPDGEVYYLLNEDNGLVSTSSIWLAANGKRLSREIYVPNTDTNMMVFSTDGGVANSATRKIELKKASINYQIAERIDKASCNGIVDKGEGCVLFNERAPDSGVAWDADLNIDATNISSFTGSVGERDSNVLLKVAPDRSCDKWLACKTYVRDEKENNICYDVGMCNSLDDKGSCDNFLVPSLDPNEQVYKNPLTDVGNLSGYNKVGQPNNTLNSSLFRFDQMKQFGSNVYVANNSFEFFSSDRNPVGWMPFNDAAWNAGLFSVINNPIDAQSEGVSYPVDGKSFLKYSPSSGEMESEFIDVEPGSEYILSYKANTKNFHPGAGFDNINASVQILTYSASGQRSAELGYGHDILECDQLGDGGQAVSTPQPKYSGCGVPVAPGLDWTERGVRFRVGSLTHRIKLLIRGAFSFGSVQPDGTTPVDYNPALKTFCVDDGHCDGARRYYPNGVCSNEGSYTFRMEDKSYTTTVQRDTCAGNVYFDDIKIKPALNTKTKYYKDQDCRLYPQSDAMSCDYYEDSGKRYKGWSGYCLEYDRAPGNPYACLMWYPVDRVYGDTEENFLGYDGRFPLYYCSQFFSRNLQVVERRPDSVNYGYGPAGGGECTGAYCKGYGCGTCRSCPNGYNFREVEEDDGWDGSENWLYCEADQSTESACAGYYEYDGDSQNFGGNTGSFDEAEEGVKLCDVNTGELFDDSQFESLFYCTDLAKVVTYGSSKQWNARAQEGTSYKVETLGYEYDMPYGPYSGANPPAPIDNPTKWDSVKIDDNFDVDPLPLKHFSDSDKYATNVNSGAPFSCTGDCTKSGICSSTRTFCYDLDIPVSSASSVNPTNSLKNPFVCASNDTCNTNFPVVSAGTNPIQGYDRIRRIFAMSYGTWHWDISSTSYLQTNNNWSTPTTICGGSPPTRPASIAGDLDYCGIPPVAGNIRVNNLGGNVRLGDTRFVNLTYTSDLDNEQMPLVMYMIDWGDLTNSSVSGIQMNPRGSAQNPHSIYHLYNYWDLVYKDEQSKLIRCAPRNGVIIPAAMSPSGNEITCNGSACCAVKPKIKLKDNWGWCTEGTTTEATKGICSYESSQVCSGGSCSTSYRCAEHPDTDCFMNSDCPAGDYCSDGYYEYRGWVIVNE